MRKLVRRYGDSYVIIFNREEREVYNIDEGDELEIEVYKVNNIKSKKEVKR